MESNWTQADVDRVRGRLGRLATELPGVETTEAAGQTSFLVSGKRLAWLLVDHRGDGRLALCVKAPQGEQETLITQNPDRYYVPAYLGSRGWVAVRLDDQASPDWIEVAALLGQAWRMTATKRAVAAYEQSRRQ